MNRTGNQRWVICALLFLSVAVNYVDRLVIGIPKKPLSSELGWSDNDYRYIAAAFSFACAFGCLFGGRAIDKLGVKRGLPLFVSLWSLATTVHGLVKFIAVQEVLQPDQQPSGLSRSRWHPLRYLCQDAGPEQDRLRLLHHAARQYRK